MDKPFIKWIVLALALGTPTLSSAHGDKQHDARSPAAGPNAMAREQKDWGIAGDSALALRTIEVRMLDSMRFSPARIDVRLGETVVFIVRNTGRVMHEFVIGTRQENAAHAALMKKFPGMEHDEPYMAHVAPGKSGRIAWTFNRPGEFEFACLIAGHYEAGMVGKIIVRSAPHPRSSDASGATRR